MAKLTNTQLKQRIKEYVNDEDILNKIVVLEGDEFASGVVGITEDYKLVYSYEKLVKSLTNSYGSEEDAVEWLEYNTLRAIPYMSSDGLLAPVIIHEL